MIIRRERSSEQAQATPAPIVAAYLLVSGIPISVDEAGRRWTDPLWLKDLREHVRYLPNLTLAAPVRREASAPSGTAAFDSDPALSGLKHVDLPASRSHLAGLLNLPPTFLRLWRAVGSAQIVHAGVADWPIPTGWAATLASLARRRTLLINVESAFWRESAAAPIPRRIRAYLWERINRWCVQRATLPLFTHEGYAREMLKDVELAHVLNASWIDSDVVIDEQSATRCWDEKASDSRLKLLFAGRLVPEKGVLQLLEVLDQTNGQVHVDFLGAGPLQEQVTMAAGRGCGVRLLTPVPYGPQFFDLLRQYQAVIVPTQTDEQPRIVYDAYSQAVSVLASGTEGNAACVTHGETGLLARGCDARALRDIIELAAADRPTLRTMGMRSREVAAAYTHQQMHLLRWRLLDRFIREATEERR